MVSRCIYIGLSVKVNHHRHVRRPVRSAVISASAVDLHLTPGDLGSVITYQRPVVLAN